MFIKAFNFIIGVKPNLKNIIFLLVTIYSVVLTSAYTKSRFEIKSLNYSHDQEMEALEEQYELEKQKSRVLLYTRYIEEKEKLLSDFKEDTKNIKEEE